MNSVVGDLSSEWPILGIVFRSQIVSQTAALAAKLSEWHVLRASIVFISDKHDIGALFTARTVPILDLRSDSLAQFPYENDWRPCILGLEKKSMLWIIMRRKHLRKNFMCSICLPFKSRARRDNHAVAYAISRLQLSAKYPRYSSQDRNG